MSVLASSRKHRPERAQQNRYPSWRSAQLPDQLVREEHAESLGVYRRCIAAVLVACLVVSGCSASQQDSAELDARSRLSQARYAVLLGSVYSGYRDADTSADGVLWLVDKHGTVVSRTGRFTPIPAAVLRSEGTTAWFTGNQVSYRLTGAGLSRYPRKHEPGNIGLVHVRSKAAPVATVNIGAAEAGQYQTQVMVLDSPESDFRVARYVDAIATCGATSYLLTTEGLSPQGARWEDLQTRRVVAEQVVESTDGIGTVSLTCEQGVVWAVDQQRTDTGEIRQVVLHRWDTKHGFTDSPVRMSQGRDGAPLGADGSWNDGSKMPTAYWWLDGHLYWLTARGEVWKTDVTTGASAQAFKAEAANAATPPHCTPQTDSVVCARQLSDRIEIDSYRLPDGVLVDHVVVTEKPPVDDLTVMDVGALGSA